MPALSPGGGAAAAVERGTVLTDLGAMREALRAAMGELFDRRQRVELERLLADDRAAFSFSQPEYPFRFERLDAVLNAALPPALDPRQTRAANDLGALLILAAARFGGGEGAVSDRLPTAAPLAFAILDRARAGGDCLPQLNLAFLLSTHERLLDDETAAEFGRAERGCPDDPTPLWLLGQFRSQRAFLYPGLEDPEEQRAAQEELRRVFATFHRLERRFPGSAAGWSGEADAELRVAYQLDELQPFSARSRFRRALTLYRRARHSTRTLDSLRARPALLLVSACTARRCALSGAHLRARLRPAALEARLVEYLERDGRFAEASARAARLAPRRASPIGPGLFMRPAERSPRRNVDEPLSLWEAAASWR